MGTQEPLWKISSISSTINSCDAVVFTQHCSEIIKGKTSIELRKKNLPLPITVHISNLHLPQHNLCNREEKRQSSLYSESMVTYCSENTRRENMTFLKCFRILYVSEFYIAKKIVLEKPLGNTIFFHLSP